MRLRSISGGDGGLEPSAKDADEAELFALESFLGRSSIKHRPSLHLPFSPLDWQLWALGAAHGVALEPVKGPPESFRLNVKSFPIKSLRMSNPDAQPAPSSKQQRAAVGCVG